MKRLLLLIAILLLPTAHVFAAFGYVIPITIQHAKVPNTDQTNFPIDVDVTQTTLKTTGNGGHVQSANGYDIYFYSDATCTTRIPAERSIYTATTGQYTGWVKKTVLTASDVIIYVCYGDASISTDPNLDGTYGATSVWDSNYKGVWHLDETGTGASGDYKDSTSNGYNSTNTTGQPTNTSTSIVGKAQSFSGSTYVQFTDNFPMGATSAVTISYWLKMTSHNVWDLVVGKGMSTNTGNTDWATQMAGGGDQYYPIRNGGNQATTNASIPTGTWTYVTLVMDASAGISYFNGALDKTQGGIGSGNTNNTASAYVTFMRNPDGSSYVVGTLDEVRVSNSLRSADWIATEYNNQSATSTFYTVGAESALGGVASFLPRMIIRALVTLRSLLTIK